MGTLFVALSAVLWIIAGLQVAFFGRRLKSLIAVDPLPDAALPSLAIIVSAKDEVARVDGAAQSLLAQDYPGVRIIIADDRSRDGTGAILDRLAMGEPRLRVIHVNSLPDGWLGKCHALALAAAEVDADWLLFTDGDVNFAPDAARRAVSLAIREGADHVAIGPDLIVEGLGEAIFVGYFVMIFYLSECPWRAQDPGADGSIGIGAFNLVRREAYERSGGHARIRFDLLDDLALGKILKQSGARQMFALHGGKIATRWNVGLGGLIHGVEKNAFAAFRYRAGVAVIAVTAQLALSLAPVAGLLMHGLTPKLAAIAAWAGIAFLYFLMSRGARIRPWQAILMPVGALLFSYAIVRSTARAVAQGGVFWRGTFYRLEELRRARTW